MIVNLKIINNMLVSKVTTSRRFFGTDGKIRGPCHKRCDTIKLSFKGRNVDLFHDNWKLRVHKSYITSTTVILDIRWLRYSRRTVTFRDAIASPTALDLQSHSLIVRKPCVKHKCDVRENFLISFIFFQMSENNEE